MDELFTATEKVICIYRNIRSLKHIRVNSRSLAD